MPRPDIIAKYLTRSNLLIDTHDQEAWWQFELKLEKHWITSDGCF
jgi:hypothetical protein